MKIGTNILDVKIIFSVWQHYDSDQMVVIIQSFEPNLDYLTILDSQYRISETTKHYSFVYYS